MEIKCAFLSGPCSLKWVLFSNDKFLREFEFFLVFPACYITQLKHGSPLIIVFSLIRTKYYLLDDVPYNVSETLNNEVDCDQDHRIVKYITKIKPHNFNLEMIT